MLVVKSLLLAASLWQTPPLSQRIDEILANPALSGALVSVTVTDERGSELYSRLSGIRVVPASNQKLLTNIFAFATLGPDYKPVTRFARVGNRVIVDAPGDPELTGETLRTVGKNLGVRSNMTVWARLAYNPGYGPSWEYDDLPNRYAPKITAFTVDEAGFEARSRAGAVVPLARELGIKVIRRPDEAGPKSEFDPHFATLIVRGKLPQDEASIDTLAQPNPLKTAAAYLGGKWGGALKELPADLKWSPLTGKPLSEVAKECLVDSDNHHAEHLLMMSAAKLAPLEAGKEYSQAAQRMGAFYAGILADPSDFRPIDGSGLSRHNFVTTRGIAQILQWAQGQPWFETFYDCLVSAGAGTLKGRNPGASFHGKTGTLNSVVSLSGYVKNAVGERRIVSVVFNHGITSSSAQRDLADKLMRTVEEDGGPTQGYENTRTTARAVSANTAHPRAVVADGDWLP
ncbi:MAG: D-alanyl-D-alanine carboxypeptidase [Chthonomonas sp.]|nr:D-alanyl-D-alanine carboxypeptidase [Chthonomonas sp.]